MIIYIANKKDYKKSDSYSKKLNYTTTIFNASYAEYKSICNSPYCKKNCVVWYKKVK